MFWTPGLVVTFDFPVLRCSGSGKGSPKACTPGDTGSSVNFRPEAP